MSDASQSDSITSRHLRPEEPRLITSLIGFKLKENSSEALVRDMQDGNMGSIRFVRSTPRVFGSVLAEAQYTDDDNVLVSISVNADNKGELFEVDFWKVDFSSLKRYPQPSELQQVQRF